MVRVAVHERRNGLPEAPGDVVAGQFVFRGGEDLSGFSYLDQIAEMEIGGALGDAGGLLHGVGDDNDGVIGLEFVDKLFDPGGGDGIEGGTGLVHQNHLGSDRDGARDTKALLLTTGKGGARLVEVVFYFFPEPGLFQAGLHDLVSGFLVWDHAMDARRVDNVVEDGLGEGIGFLEYHADSSPYFDHIDGLVIDVFASEFDLSAHMTTVDGVVHPVEASQEGGFPTTGRTDNGGDLFGADIHGHVSDGGFVAKIDTDIARRHAGFGGEDLSDGVLGVLFLREFGTG